VATDIPDVRGFDSLRSLNPRFVFGSLRTSRVERNEEQGRAFLRGLSAARHKAGRSFAG